MLFSITCWILPYCGLYRFGATEGRKKSVCGDDPAFPSKHFRCSIPDSPIILTYAVILSKLLWPILSITYCAENPRRSKLLIIVCRRLCTTGCSWGPIPHFHNIDNSVPYFWECVLTYWLARQKLAPLWRWIIQKQENVRWILGAHTKITVNNEEFVWVDPKINLFVKKFDWKWSFIRHVKTTFLMLHDPS